jgi:ribosome-associated protein
VQSPRTSYEIAVMVANWADGKKAKDIKVLRTEHITSLADYFVICSGDSSTQIRSLTDSIESNLKLMGIELVGEEQDKSGHWHLLDYGPVVVHIMHTDTRAFYQIEDFWNHAECIPAHHWQETQRQAS